MKTLKIKSIAFSLLAMMVLSVFMTSCEQEVIPTPEPLDLTEQRVEVVASDLLQANDVKVAELKTIVESEVTAMGTPQFDMVTFIEYSEPGATALILPFTHETGSRTLISYFNDGVYTNSFYLEFSPTQAYREVVANNPEAAYSGEIIFYTKSGEVVSSSTLQEGAPIAIYTNPELRSCMSDCLGGAWDSLPASIKGTLAGTFGACVFAGHHASCAILAGVLGGVVWYCKYIVC